MSSPSGNKNNLTSNAGAGAHPLVKGNNSDLGSVDDLQFNASLDALFGGSEQVPTTHQYHHTNSRSSTASMAPPPPPQQGLFACNGYPDMDVFGQNSTSGQTNIMMTSFGAGKALSSGNSPRADVVTSSGSNSNLKAPTTSTSRTSPRAGRKAPPPSSASISSASASASKKSTKRGSNSSVSSSSASKRRRRGGGDNSSCNSVSEDESDAKSRKRDRNLREQQRSHRITQQIEELRSVLAQANIPFKPDKYNTLVTVAEYIKQLQQKSSMLDSEHSKLLQTVQKTNEMVNNQYISTSTSGVNAPGEQVDGTADDTDDMVYVQGIDYESVFQRCGVPLAVASIDGRFMDCNRAFEKLTGYSRDELVPVEHVGDIPLAVSSMGASKKNVNTSKNLSLFNLLQREDMESVFLSMSQMLQQPEPDELHPSTDYWSGVVRLSRNPTANVSPYRTCEYLTTAFIVCYFCMESSRRVLIAWLFRCE
jgi:PAS domain-containing protein